MGQLKNKPKNDYLVIKYLEHSSQMSNNSLFSLCNALAMFSWIALALFPRKVWVKRIVQSVVVILFAIIYCVLVGQSLSLQDMQSFGSLGGSDAAFYTTHGRTGVLGPLPGLRPDDGIVCVEQRAKTSDSSRAVDSLLVFYVHAGAGRIAVVHDRAHSESQKLLG